MASRNDTSRQNCEPKEIELTYPKIASFKTLADFRSYLAEENLSIPLADDGKLDALATPITCAGRTVGNRWAILPMEGWDCTASGAPSELTRRRWLNFAASGAKMIYGTEAAAVMHSGRSNPYQLLIDEQTKAPLKELCSEMRAVHRNKFGTDDDLLIGLQLTHSGRYAHPNSAAVLESQNAYDHPLLDIKFGKGHVVTDEEVRDIIQHFVHAAKLAHEAGFDFVDIKQAHGYLGHEFLTAFDRPGSYGGSFENRTRFFREICEGIRRECPDLILSSRLSIFDIFPFVKGDDGTGVPMAWDTTKPYPYAFGGDGKGMEMDPDLKEPVALVKMMQELGIDFICATIGSPYYNVHMQRPAYFPVCDGYLPPENPLYNVSRHLLAVKRLKELYPGMKVIAAGLTCLQDYTANAAGAIVANGEADFAGIGRMAISYPNFCADSLAGKKLERSKICRTFGDCTNAPRNGMVSGCYPLDDHYKCTPQAETLKAIKKSLVANR